MDLIPIASVIRVVVGWLPSFMLRWYYTPSRLSRLIYVDLRPREDSALLNLAPASSLRIVMQVINLSPFPVELDRAVIHVDCGTAPLAATNLERRSVQPGEIATVPFSCVIPDGHANQIVQHNPDDFGRLDGVFEFNCRVRPFTRTVPDLRGIYFRRVNVHRRKGDA